MTGLRTHYCGELRLEQVGEQVSVCGWVASRREHGEHLAFIDVRDHTGVIQCVVDHAHDLRGEYVVRVSGTVRRRPEGTANPTLATGDVEIGDCDVEVLNESLPPPFPVTDRVEADEVLRIRHRYVDLRRNRLQRNLRLRARVNKALRAAMDRNSFVEVETAFLIASTPEGSRDFVVPSRHRHGSFYALPQSPQLLKQLLMVGGFDRYYQIARCARDEDFRADRQIEFTQFDLEMAFASEPDVQAVITEAVADATEAATGTRPGEFGRMTWLDAVERFGTDKPDVRFGMELVELTEVFAMTEFRAFQTECVKAIRVEGGGEMSRTSLDGLTDNARQWGAAGLVWIRVREDGAIESPVAKFISQEERVALLAATGAVAGDLLLAVAGERTLVRHVLGLLRTHIGAPPINEGGLSFLWLDEFPLFEGIDDGGRPIPAHHMFTAVHPEDLDLISSDPLKVRSRSYDLVVNGWELGSGSVRIHRSDVQQKVFSAVGIGPEDAERRFGFLLEAFRYGAPPHAGFAFGIDRLAAVLAGEENIREVIAFPKTQTGADPLTGAPAPLDAAQLAELGIQVSPRAP